MTENSYQALQKLQALHSSLSGFRKSVNFSNDQENDFIHFYLQNLETELDKICCELFEILAK